MLLVSCCRGFQIAHFVALDCYTFYQVNDELAISESLVQAVNFYQNDIPHEVMFSTEYHMWVNKWRDSENDAPTKLVDLWKACNKTSFPNIYILL